MKYSNGKGRIISTREVAPHHHLMKIEAPFSLTDALPGTFVMIKVSDGLVPILRRPFGIYSTDKKAGSFEILIRVVGEGTRLLSEMAPGVSLDILGPLGRGFDLDLSGETPLLVAGGVGVAPLFTLAEALLARAVKVKILVGGRSKGDLLAVDALKQLGAHVLTATEDGSDGYPGYVTDLMAKEIAGKEAVTAVYVCGPHLMLKKAAEIATASALPCQLSLEAIMACGFGVCLGCVIKTCTKKSDAQFDYSRVCCEGPVFDAREVIWDEH